MEESYKIKPAGDCAIVVEFENVISEEVNNRVAALRDNILKSDLCGRVNCIPTYRSILIQYRPNNIKYKELRDKILGLIEKSSNSVEGKKKVYVVPVLYGGDYGPDLDHVASTNALTSAQVIEKHTAVDYRIYMLGFTPGFPYLGGMDESIATPRLQQPRTKIHGGSVGIAGKQTGIYPMDSPGGWQIIGRTPLKLFDVQQKPPVLLEAGSYIRFEQVSLEDYKRIEEKVASGGYTCRVEYMNQGGA